MSVCAVMLVRDEADIIAATVDHLLWHVDEILVWDHRSTDGTREILDGLPVTLLIREDLAYHQSHYTTFLALVALQRGHDWVLPCDADEIWHGPSGDVAISDYCSYGLDRPVLGADLVNHIPTGLDDPALPAFERMRWRQRQYNSVKVCCRLRDDLVIHEGNHSASYGGVKAEPEMVFAVRHFTARSEEQFVRKVRNMQQAYRAEGSGYDYGMVQFENYTDADLAGHFWSKIYVDEPVYHLHVEDPAPLKIGSRVR